MTFGYIWQYSNGNNMTMFFTSKAEESDSTTPQIPPPWDPNFGTRAPGFVQVIVGGLYYVLYVYTIYIYNISWKHIIINMVYLYIYIYMWLVVFNHLEKYEFVIGKDDIPDMKWKIKFMLETTKQYIYIYHSSELAHTFWGKRFRVPGPPATDLYQLLLEPRSSSRWESCASTPCLCLKASNWHQHTQKHGFHQQMRNKPG